MNIWVTLQSVTQSIVSALLDLFPTVNQANIDAFTENISGFRDMLHTASWIFPVNNMLLLLGVILSIELSLFTYRFIKLIIGYVSLGFVRD